MSHAAFDAARPHLWRGQWVDDATLDRHLATLATEIHADLGRAAPLEALLRAADRLARRLAAGPERDAALVAALCATLEQDPALDAAAAHQEVTTLAEVLCRTALERKLERELGSLRPQLPRRIDAKGGAFEAWAPLGLLVHIAPGNVASVAPLSVIEGLLAGNLNVLKTSGHTPPFAQRVLAALLALDESGTLAPFVSVVAVSSREIERLQPLFALADGIAVWGGEAAVAAIRGLAPTGCRVVEWGHKISFAYLAAESLDDEAALEAVAHDVCLIEQQACSSPQCLYIEVPDRAALFAFAERFAGVLARVSTGMPQAPGAAPQPQEWADITTATLLAELETAWDDSTRVFAAPDRSWRVLAEDHPALRTSPLFRTIWIKPMTPAQIVDTLRPMRSWLQTAGLACPTERVAELAERLIAAGVTRIARVGEQLGGYAGEPHDGVYALPRYSRRVSLELPAALASVSSFDELVAPVSPLRPGTPILDKAGFIALQPDPAQAQLFVRSGGSTGAPKFSAYSWADFHAQMQAGADGLRAAGLDPAGDRVMNLFFGGHMYGGFLSFWSALEILGVTQFPMAAVEDMSEVADAIIRFEVNTLVGMPFYLNRLFTAEAERLRAYGGIRKVFFGGEHMQRPFREQLHAEFGVEIVRAAAYGSNDAGPLGYQCEHCADRVYHLLSSMQYLEILDLEADRPADPGVPGRLVFTSLQRSTIPLERYEIGDLGRWVEDPCPCGRGTPRYELLGRHGDIFRASDFFSYGHIVDILAEEGGYAGPVQLELSLKGSVHHILVRVQQDEAPPAERVRQLLIEHYTALREELADGKGDTALDVELAPLSRFVAAPVTGKLKSIVDLRITT